MPAKKRSKQQATKSNNKAKNSQNQINVQAHNDFKKLIAAHEKINHPLVWLAFQLKHIFTWSVKLIVPDFLVGHPNLFDNLRTLRKHPRFKPLRMLLVSWLVVTLVMGGTGWYILDNASNSEAEGAKWLFDKSENFSFDSSKIDISQGKAKLKSVDQIDDDNTADGFGGGKQQKTEWNTSTNQITLNKGGRQSGHGQYTSRIINGGSSQASWENFSWVPQQPYGKELPDNQTIETDYASGNADMTANELLYHLNETSGPLADSSGQGAKGEAFKGVDYGAEGIFNSGLYFDGKDDYVALDKYYATPGGLTELTSCAWFKVAPGEGGWSLIDFDRSEYFNLEVGYYNRDSNVINFATRGYQKSIHDLVGKKNVRDNKWHFACGVYDGTDKIIYVDGVEDARVKNPHGGAGLGTGVTRYGFIGDGSEATSYNQSRNGFYFKGFIDEVAVYHRTLSDSEILSQYQRGALSLKYQVRSCADAACQAEDFKGPDGTNDTYYSELDNNDDLTPSLSLQNISADRYFQYRAYLETRNSLYSPSLSQVKIDPIHYPTDYPSIINKYPLPQFTALDGFIEATDSQNQGTVKYQISNNGTDWYHWSDNQWQKTTKAEEANSSHEIDKQIKSFADSVGEGTFYFQAFLYSDGLQAVELDQVEVSYSYEEKDDSDQDEPDDQEEESDEKDEDQDKEEEPDNSKDDEQTDKQEKESKDQKDDDQKTEKDTEDDSDQEDQDDGDKKDQDQKESKEDDQTTSRTTTRWSNNSTTTGTPYTGGPQTFDSQETTEKLTDINKETDVLLEKINQWGTKTYQTNGNFSQVNTVEVVDITSLLAELSLVSSKLKQVIEPIIGNGEVIAEVLTIPSIEEADVEMIKNKALDLQALANNIKYLLENGRAPVTTTWYTFGTLNFKVLLTNPTDQERKISLRTCLPEEVKEENILEKDEDLKLEYDEGNQCLAVMVADMINPKESKIKKIKVDDLWSISEEELNNLRDQSDNLAAELANTYHQNKAQELKQENLDLINQITRKQRESKATPQEHILAFRELKNDLQKVKDNIVEMEKIKDNVSGFSGMMAQLGRAQVIARGGIYSVIVSGIILILFVIYRMWKHQMELVATTMSLNTETLSLIKKQRSKE